MTTKRTTSKPAKKTKGATPKGKAAPKRKSPAKKKAPPKQKKAAPKKKAAPQAAPQTPWADVVSRVIGEPSAARAAEPEPMTQPAPPKVEAPAPKATTIRFPTPAPQPKQSANDTFGNEEWVSVTYLGEEVFVHGKAGIFARGTTTHLRGKLARELANQPGFRLRRAA